MYSIISGYGNSISQTYKINVDDIIIINISIIILLTFKELKLINNNNYNKFDFTH